MKFESLNEHPAVRFIPYMGVINVVAEAAKLGFYNGNPEWSNMGQGQPEVGPIEGAPERLLQIELDPHDAAYGHINGIRQDCGKQSPIIITSGSAKGESPSTPLRTLRSPVAVV